MRLTNSLPQEYPSHARPEILELSEALDANSSWGCGRILERWTNKQTWRPLPARTTHVYKQTAHALLETRTNSPFPLRHGRANGGEATKNHDLHAAATSFAIRYMWIPQERCNIP